MGLDSILFRDGSDKDLIIAPIIGNFDKFYSD
jgi:hypothetical protein